MLHLKKNIILRISMVLIFIMLNLIGCEVEQYENESEKEIVAHEGLKVKLKEGVPQDALSLDSQISMDDLLEQYSTKFGKISVPLSVQELGSITQDIMQDRYPNFSGKMTKRDIEIIKKDFFDISDDLIEENIETIVLVYEKQLIYEVYKFCSNRKKSNSFTVKLDIPDLTSGELKLLIRYPWNAPSYASASLMATHAANEVYGANYNNTRSNAFTHCFWSILICKYCPGTSLFGGRKSRTKFARLITTAHEEKDSGESKIMDLHNNSVGISYVNDYYMPSNTDVSKWIINTINKAEYYEKPSQLSFIDMFFLKIRRVLIYIKK